MLVIARQIGGIGVGITAMASPTYMSEVSPAKYRGRMVALYQLAITLGIVATAAIWMGAFAVSLLYPVVSKSIGVGGAFGAFAALTAVAILFIWKLQPETKGRTLEEIEAS